MRECVTFFQGMIWVNGFNLGRYWPIVGPQVTLYLPAPLLKTLPEKNTFLIFELEGAPDACLTAVSSLSSLQEDDSDNCFITLTDTHVLDRPTPFQAKRRLFKKN